MDGEWDINGEYTPSDEQVSQHMYDWNVVGNRTAVFHWLKMLAESRWFATAIFFPGMWNGVFGVFLCLSTAEATRVSKANAEVNDEMRRMGGIDTPEWLYFHVYFFGNLVFMNLYGFKNPQGVFLGTLGEVLDHLSTAAGLRD